MAAWFERWIIAQAFWLILTTILLVFVLSRLVPILGTRRPPYCFVWIPAALVLGIVGTALTAIGAARSQQYWALHELGRSMVLQGLFLGLVLGVGSFALPLMTRGAPPPDAAWHRQAIWPLALHLLGVAALVASFLVETWVSVRLGLGLRGTVVWIVLLAQAHLFLPPTRTGFARWSMWLAAWCVPIGYTLAALSPFAVKGPLHVTFIGGFGLLALSVSSHVILGHGDYRALQSGYPRPLIAMTAALFLAAGARVMMVARGEEVLMWATLAAGLFLASTALWASFLVPRLFRPARADEI